MSVMVVTSLGEIVIDLFTDRCPLTCKNFLKLCKIKYYNGCLFHTVQKDFTAQTGDPTGTGAGGDSIYKYLYGDQARFFNDEIHPDLKHSKMGTIAMASAGENLNASQFYMTLRDDLDYLDEKHTVFGEVAEGHDTLMRINEAYVDEKGRPFKNIRIKHTYVLDDPFEDPPELAGLIPDASPVGKPNEEVDDEVRLEDDWVPMDEQIPAEDLEEIIREKEAHSRAVVLETINDIPDADVKPPENVLFVCKLNPVTEDEDLHTIFSRFGTVTSAEVIRDYKTGDSLCYAFIEFDDKDACERAYFKMDNALIDDRRIHVDFSQSVSKLWNQFRRKGIQGKGCFKCGALDHIAKDCTGESTMPHQKFVLKDDNQQRGGGKNANYEMVFDEEGSPQRGKRQRDNASGRSDYKSERLEPRVGQRAHLVNRDSSERDSQRRRIGEPGHDARKDDRDRKETRNGRSRDDRDVREIKHGHSKDDIDRTDSKYERRTYEKDTRERRGDGERRSSDIDSKYKKDETSRRKGIPEPEPEPDRYRSRREERHSSKSHGDRHDEKLLDGRNEPRHRREMESDHQRSRREERDHRSPKSNTHRGGDERRRSDRR